MALTLAEAAKLSNDMLLQGVVETIVKESPVLQRLPFIEIVGNGLTYNQEKSTTALLCPSIRACLGIQGQPVLSPWESR